MIGRNLRPTAFGAFLAWAFLAPAILPAQTTRVSGTVTDASSGEPLPFVNVGFIDSRVSANSDFDGHYVLDTYFATDSIKAVSVGYQPFTAKVKRDAAQTIDIRLQPATEKLPDVVVTYAGNPAFPILRRVIANKPVNNREKLAAYQYESYNKVEFDLNNITEEFKKKKLFKDFAFIFNYVDTAGGKPFLPIFMTETMSEVYYRQAPKVKRELIHGSKVSGVENPSIAQFMGDMYQNVNIYHNFIVIFGKNFVSPIADGGRGFYEYHLLDSNWVGHNWCYKISFSPKREQELAFAGSMWVNDTSYAVKSIEATIDKGANLNFVQGFQVKQEYSEVVPEVWMLTKDQLLVDLNVITGKDKVREHPVQGFYGRRTATYRNFVINKPMPPDFYKGADAVVMDIDPLSYGAAYWEENRHENLTPQEVGIYHMVDTMKTIPKFRTYVDIVNAVVTGYYTKGKFDIGPYFSMYSFNPIEGNRFRIGGRTSSNFNKRKELNGYLAYGTRDGRFKFGVGGRAFVSKASRQIVSVGYKLDVEQLGESVNAFRQDNILSSVFRRTPNTKLTLVEESRASYQREWFTGFDNTLLLRYRTLRPLGELEYLQPAASGEPPTMISSIHTAEVALNTRFAFREKYISGDFKRVSLGTKYPTLELHLAMGVPKLAISEYGYRKMVAHVYQRIQMGVLGWTRVNAEAGRIWGNLPYPLLILHSGNETFYYDDLAFNTMNYFEFISDRYAQLFVEHHFEGLFFNRIPLLRRLKWREVVVGKAVAGSLDLARTQQEMLLLPGMYTLDRGPYVEVAAGVENIFKLLRVDAVWRLRYNDHPHTNLFALRLKLFVNF